MVLVIECVGVTITQVAFYAVYKRKIVRNPGEIVQPTLRKKMKNDKIKC